MEDVRQATLERDGKISIVPWRGKQRMSKRARVVIGILIAIIIVAGAGIAISARQLEPRLRDWVVSTLSESLESEVELGSVKLSWVPLRLYAENLSVRHRGRTDVPPLIVVKSFSVDLRPTDLWGSTVEHVKVDGLEVNFPPKDPKTGKRPLPKPAGDEDSDTRRLRRAGGEAADGDEHAPGHHPARRGEEPEGLGHLRARDEEPPVRRTGHVYRIARQSNSLKARLKRPELLVPGNRTSPATRQLRVITRLPRTSAPSKGSPGDLNAVGKMDGTIEQIKTTGQTRTDKFGLTELDGDPLSLTTSYEALVDGTKGDVELHRVDVHLGKSEFIAKGVIEGTKGVKGKRVVVNVKSQNANLAELLRFVSKAAQPPAYGNLRDRYGVRSSAGQRARAHARSARRVRARRAGDASPTTPCRTRLTS